MRALLLGNTGIQRGKNIPWMSDHDTVLPYPMKCMNFLFIPTSVKLLSRVSELLFCVGSSARLLLGLYQNCVTALIYQLHFCRSVSVSRVPGFWTTWCTRQPTVCLLSTVAKQQRTSWQVVYWRVQILQQLLFRRRLDCWSGRHSAMVTSTVSKILNCILMLNNASLKRSEI